MLKFIGNGGNSLIHMKIELGCWPELSIPLERIMLTGSIRECAEQIAERSLP
ncbi:hypothetical protein XSR1_160004 [Xenorhabdus szentirmaii DSM 16338]|uniref:Uncharacterized protein n=1 Tax=Xenorhabdus szentirmaii DSM 16338 TaxID=1427518 RepID=W1IVB3_9GAMM|nr:hypothetical protein XSR1_160004 [Xenorhabdus szentirmaii DSM 16338]